MICLKMRRKIGNCRVVVQDLIIKRRSSLFFGKGFTQDIISKENILSRNFSYRRNVCDFCVSKSWLYVEEKHQMLVFHDGNLKAVIWLRNTLSSRNNIICEWRSETKIVPERSVCAADDQSK